MVPEFANAVASLKVGTYTTTPIKTQFGYHIIYLYEKKPSEPISFEQAKNNILQGLKMEKLQDIVKAKVAAAEKNVKIEIK
jgi:parvulin-like peptidyl-prolyl isomerase